MERGNFVNKLGLTEIEYWVNTSNGYDNRYITIETNDPKQAIIEAKKVSRSKDHKIYKP
jgi:hypothetical protein